MQEPATAHPRRGDQLTVRIDTLAQGGAGVARHDGYVVFVAGAIPGDTVRVTVGKAKRAYAQARVLEVIEPSPERTAPRASHPGMPWQVIPYARQLEVKQRLVDEALARIGKLDGYVLEPIVPALAQWRYRNKLEYSFGRAADDGRLVCGFHAPGSFEEIVALDDCLLASQAGNRVREEVLAGARAQGLEPYDRRTGEGFLRNLVVREGRRSGELQARLITSSTGVELLDSEALIASVPSASALLWTRLEHVGETTSGGQTTLLSGVAQLREQLGALTLEISPQAFFQTNTEMAERLYALALEYAQLTGFEQLYDLYCGIGTIGLLAAPHAGRVYGIEIVEDAIRDAVRNARTNQIDNATFIAADVRHALRELVTRSGRPDVLIVDPPRAGLSQRVVRRVIEAAPSRIVYVSCNPTTLAPNAAQLVAAGYALRKVRPVDMFPQTPHIECVAQLERR